MTSNISTTDVARNSNLSHGSTRSGSLKIPRTTLVSQSISSQRPNTPDQRPNLQPQRPSWIGPPAAPRPITPGIPTMTQKVKVTYNHAGLQPPVYFAGSIGERPWEPVEMQSTEGVDGEHGFWQEFDVEEGEYQYKFRLGPGDWWALDETKQIVDDGAGNRNNLLVVNAVPEHSALPSHSNHADAEMAPAFEHEAAFTSPVKIVKDIPNHDSDEQAPVFRYESTAAAETTPVHADVFDDDDDNEVEQDQIASPLFRHESLGPIHTHHLDQEDHAPLFRHESMSPLEARSSNRSNSATSNSSNPFDAEDINDPSLEKFPTDRNDILAHLHRASSRRSDEDVGLDTAASSPSLSSTRSLSAAASPSLSLAKVSSDHLDCIDESEELSPEVPTESEGLGIKSVEEPSVPELTLDDATRSAADKVENTPKLSISPSHEPVNRGPLTPPLTPITEFQTKVGARAESVHIDLSPEKESLSPRVAKDDSTEPLTSRPSSKSSPAPFTGKDDHGNLASFWGWIDGLLGGRISTVGIAVAVGVAAAVYAVTGKANKA